MMRAETVARVAVAFLAVYVGLIVYQGEEHEKHRVYPFGAWSVFSHVPNPERRDFSVRLLAVRGEELDRPVYAEEARDLIPASQSTTVMALAVDMGMRPEAEARRARTVLEERFLADLAPVRYQVVRRGFHVFERYECGCFSREDVVDTFELAP